MLTLYPTVGFEPFAEYWNKYCAYRGEKVKLFDHDREHTGILTGVNLSGELVLEDEDGCLHSFSRSELSLRPVLNDS